MFSDRVNQFNRDLHFTGILPENIRMMNPYTDPQVYETACAFYDKYYRDVRPRRLILGINPGRLGAGTTGVPFTDPKRLTEICGLSWQGPMLHEPSSVFIYDMIAAFGGPGAFYGRYYIHSVCPLGLVRRNATGRETNYNYFDSRALEAALQDFIEWNIATQIDLGCETETAWCLGRSKNYQYLLALNNRKKYFGRIVSLDHPRFIMQYKVKEKESYIADYLNQLR